MDAAGRTQAPEVFFPYGGSFTTPQIGLAEKDRFRLGPVGPPVPHESVDFALFQSRDPLIAFQNDKADLATQLLCGLSGQFGFQPIEPGLRAEGQGRAMEAHADS